MSTASVVESLRFLRLLCSRLTRVDLCCVTTEASNEPAKQSADSSPDEPPHTSTQPKQTAEPAADGLPPPAAVSPYLPDLSLTLSLSLLACVAGWVDTVSFIGFIGLFTAHITGNFAVIGANIAGENPTGGSNLVRLLSIPVFLIGGALAAAFIRVLETRALVPHIGGRKGTPVKSDEGPRPIAAAVTLLLFEAAMLGVSMGLALKAAPITDLNSGHVLALFAGLFAVFGMGIHGACGRLLFPHLGPLTKSVTPHMALTHPQRTLTPRCTRFLYATDDRSHVRLNGVPSVMTTTSVVLSIDFVDLLRGARVLYNPDESMAAGTKQKEYAELSRRFCRYLSAVVFFVIGSLLGGLAFKGITWYAMLVPMGMLIGFAVVIVAFPDILDRSRG